MEEIILRFSLIGQAIFKELNGRDFCKSKEVTQSWYHFISNERDLQRAYKSRIEDKIHSLTEDEAESYPWSISQCLISRIFCVDNSFRFKLESFVLKVREITCTWTLRKDFTLMCSVKHHLCGLSGLSYLKGVNKLRIISPRRRRRQSDQQQYYLQLLIKTFI